MTLFRAILFFLCAGVLSAQVSFYGGGADGEGNFFFPDKVVPVGVKNAPSDTDWERISLLTGSGFANQSVLVAFRKGSGSVLYLFDYVAADGVFKYREEDEFVSVIFGSADGELKNLPSDLDVSSFSVAGSGATVIYFGLVRTSSDDPEGILIAQSKSGFLFDFEGAGSGQLGFDELPDDLDWDDWGVSEQGGVFNLYVRKAGSTTTYYRAELAGTIFLFKPQNSEVKIKVAEPPFGATRHGGLFSGNADGNRFIFLLNAGVGDVFPTRAELEDGWYWTEWFGVFNASFFPWIYREDTGWMWVAGDAEDGLFLYREGTNQWLWTTSDAFPAVVDLTTGVWGEL